MVVVVVVVVMVVVVVVVVLLLLLLLLLLLVVVVVVVVVLLLPSRPAQPELRGLFSQPAWLAACAHGRPCDVPDISQGALYHRQGRQRPHQESARKQQRARMTRIPYLLTLSGRCAG